MVATQYDPGVNKDSDVYTFGYEKVGEACSQPAYVEPLATFQFQVKGLDGTPFKRPSDPNGGPQISPIEFSAPTSPTQARTAGVIDQVDTYYSKGISITTATQNGIVSGGAPSDIARIVIYDYTRGQMFPYPTSKKGLAKQVSTEGMTVFAYKTRRTSRVASVKFNGKIAYGGPVLVRKL